MPKDNVPEITKTSTANYVSTPTYNAILTAANYGVLVAVSTLGTVIVQSPISSMGLNKMKDKTYFPPVSGGPLGIVRFLYTGFASSLAASSIRTGYVSGAKKFGPASEVGETVHLEEPMHEVAIESKAKVVKPAGYTLGLRGFIVSVTLGEVAVTQFSNTYNDLFKLGTINKEFKWKTPYNFATLNTTRIGSRFNATLINFTSLCMLEQKISAAIPLPDGPLKHTMGGLAGGVVSALAAFPFVAYRYVALAKVTVDDKGRLITPSVLELAESAVSHVKKVGAKQAAAEVLNVVAGQLPLRVARTALTFGVICGVDAALGKHPLARLGFFSRPDDEKPSAVSDAPAPSTEPSSKL